MDTPLATIHEAYEKAMHMETVIKDKQGAKPLDTATIVTIMRKPSNKREKK